MAKDPRIYSALYKVRVPKMATRTELDLELYGTPVLNVGEDEVIEDQKLLTTVFIPLIKIADIAYSGFPVYVSGTSNVNDIHLLLEDYLQSEVKSVGPNKIINREDLTKLEFLAESVFKINIGELGKKFHKGTTIEDHADQFGLMETGNKFGSSLQIPEERTPIFF